MAERDGRVLLSGWGRTARTAATPVCPVGVEAVTARVAAAGPRGVLARGAALSYGDAAQNAGGVVIDTRRLGAIGPLGDDGGIECGAGATLDALLARLVPAGRFVAVTPGTCHVTLGGALASDVHGKNHEHVGTLARHVEWLELVDGLGRLRRLRPGEPLFDATCGGLGLTGVITRLRLRTVPLASTTMRVDTVRTRDLDQTVALLAESPREHRVAWLDTTRTLRGIVTLADHADEGDPLSWAARRVLPAPPCAPRQLLTPRRVAAFNEVYFRRLPGHSTDAPVPLRNFLYPLDGVSGWNRLYGRAGFVQYQFVCPELADVVRAAELLRAARAPAFLVVLKRLGAAAAGHLAFPREGWTLALDLPARAELAPLLDRLDRLVADAGGRVYLTKDARLRPELLAVMYPRLSEWQAVRAEADPRGVFRSDLGRRLGLCR